MYRGLLSLPQPQAWSNRRKDKVSKSPIAKTRPQLMPSCQGGGAPSALPMIRPAACSPDATFFTRFSRLVSWRRFIFSPDLQEGSPLDDVIHTQVCKFLRNNLNFARESRPDGEGNARAAAQQNHGAFHALPDSEIYTAE